MSDTELEAEEALTGGEDQTTSTSANLIRGHIDTIILRCLFDEDKYGYDIIGEIEKKTGGLYKIKQPSLYSALTRLEKSGCVLSYNGEFSNGGRRKYFSLTDRGRELVNRNLSEWEYSRTIIDSLISDGDAHTSVPSSTVIGPAAYVPHRRTLPLPHLMSCASLSPVIGMPSDHVSFEIVTRRPTLSPDVDPIVMPRWTGAKGPSAHSSGATANPPWLNRRTASGVSVPGSPPKAVALSAIKTAPRVCRRGYPEDGSMF